MNRTSVKARLKKFEGLVPHMYRCTGGEVTIGIGHAIHDSAAALKLPWMMDGAPAAGAEVEADYGRVAAAEAGKVASSYAPLSRCRMNEEQCEQLVDADIVAFEAKLAAALPKWSTYPAPAQEALFDMAFNLGIGGLEKFRKLLAAADAGDWLAAAAECHRRGIAESRNEETVALFRQAAAEA